MKTALTAEHWKSLDKQIPIGETLGILFGQMAASLALSIRHPVVGASELCGSMEGLFSGLKTGINISRCNFEKRLVTNDYLTANKAGEAIKGNFNKLSEKTKKAFTRLQQLPQNIQDEIMSELEPEVAAT
jgi:hypothetical protein